MGLGVPKIETWSEQMVRNVEAVVKHLGTDARNNARWLEEFRGLDRHMAARVRRYVKDRGLPGHAVVEPPPPAPSRVTDEDLSVSRWGDVSRPTKQAGFRKQPIPEDAEAEESDEAIINRAEARFEREKAAAATRGPRRLEMPPGPYAIVHFGDPHLDDPGCDWPALKRDVSTIRTTEGMYGANGGDSMNLWPETGRLAGLYADQTTTVDEGFRMTRWLLRSVKRWPYILWGNHDKWRGGVRAIRQMGEEEGLEIGVMQADDIRVELVSPNGSSVKIHARHDFPGGSQFSHTHALKRAALWDGWADLYCAFHRHVAEVRQEEGGDGRFRTFLRARGYKRFDDYAREKGFHEQEHGAAITTVVDPDQTHPAERVRAFWSVQEAAEALTWLRRRRGVA